MSGQIGVSVLCLAFNHEKYIADAIEGFLSQKTTFPFEIIIHDDASTDSTAEIIRSYEAEYPNLIKPIYQKENQYSQGISINKDFFLPNTHGKYVALCDGDDYWTDPSKLQKQFDALEAHPDCLMCLHKVWDYNINEGEKQAKKYLPKSELSTGVIPSERFFEVIGNGDFFNEVCYFFRADAYREYQTHYPLFAQKYMKSKTDDMPMLLYFGDRANVYYISDEMAVYRRFNAGSWSAGQTQKSTEELAIFFSNSVAAIEEFNKYSNNRYLQQINYIHKYFKFNYMACIENYHEMLSPEFDCVWKRQSENYRKRVELLSKNHGFWHLLFKLYDRLRA